jgi:hypothetical protein
MGRTRIRRHAQRTLFALAGVLCAAGIGASAAQAASPLAWAAPVQSDSSPGTAGLTALSCQSTTLCMAVDDNGNFLSSSAPAGGAWGLPASINSPATHPHLTAISCPSAALCFAVDNAGNLFSSTAPTSAAAWTLEHIDLTTPLNGVSCPSTALCVAVDNAGNILTSTTPGTPASWATMHLDGTNHITAVSCPTATLCAAVDDHGNVLLSTTPTTAWQPLTLLTSTSFLTAVSCNSTGLCVAVAHDGGVHATANAASPTPTWSATPLDSGHVLSGVSCTDVGLCVAVDNAGNALESDNPAAGPPNWTTTPIDATHPALTGVSCLPAGFCVAVDTFGDTIAATLPAPVVVTGAGAASSQTAASVAASVNPNDAALADCHFDYGPTTAYGASVPCTVVPSATGGSQTVVAALGGLNAATTYHFRIAAASGVATTVGADASFMTPAPLKANPSLSGTPAVGSTLTCKPNVTTTATETVTYAWLRDTLAIAGAASATYVIAAADETHHLSCQVTIAGDGGSASAMSGFDAVPSQTQGKITETFVGTAKRGATSVKAPVTCSPQASGSCTITLLLTTTQTIRHKSQKVNVGSSMTNLGAAKTQTLSVSLNATGRRLVKEQKRLPKKRKRLETTLTVTGTILGTLTATLQADRFVFGTKAKHATLRTRLTATTPLPSPVAPGGGGAARAQSATAVLAATPYMGWDTYFALPGGFPETAILEEADQLKATGLEAKGYSLIWLDAGWWQGQRDASRNIMVSPTQWPHGIAWLASALHANGFQLGVYTDAGTTGCGVKGGSFGHYQQDVNTLAAWGVDAIKVDWCGGFAAGLDPATAYAQIHAAILANSSHRPMLLNICNFLQPGQQASGVPSFSHSAFVSYSFGPSDGNSWRTNTDIGVPGNVPFSNVLRNIDADATQPTAAGPGHWNDPDYLGPDQGMSAAQFQTQFSMWAMLAAPLMISDNMLKISKASLATLSNRQVIAIDQDPAGVQAGIVSWSDAGQVWIKPLSDGSYAVALLNRGSTPIQVATSAAALKLSPAHSYKVVNLWTNQHSTTTGVFTAQVQAYSTVLLRVSGR